MSNAPSILLTVELQVLKLAGNTFEVMKMSDLERFLSGSKRCIFTNIVFSKRTKIGYGCKKSTMDLLNGKFEV